MTNQMNKEIIKAFAYSKTAEEVDEVTGMSLAEATEFAETNAVAIAEKKAELKEAGYLE